MDEARVESSETLIKKDHLQKSIDLSRKGFETAISYFKDRRGEAARYAHLSTVVDSNHVIQLKDKKMTEALQELGLDSNAARTWPAFYLDESRGIVVDSVVVRIGVEVKPIVMLHEFVHRSSHPEISQQIYEVLGYPDKKLERLDPDKDAKLIANVNETVEVFIEGLTQWATLQLANRTEDFNPPASDVVYAKEVAAVAEAFQGFLSNRGLTAEQIEELMLDLALTGDFSRIRAKLPVDNVLKRKGFRSDFHVANLIRLVKDSYDLGKL